LVDLCPICSYEHLLKSATYLNEAKGSESDTPRYKDKIRDSVRELLSAQEHDPDPAFANRIRDFRLKKVEAPLFGGKIETSEVLDDLQEMIDEAEKRLPQEESVGDAHVKYHKGKGHAKDYETKVAASECEAEVKECIAAKAGESEEECREMLGCPA